MIRWLLLVLAMVGCKDDAAKPSPAKPPKSAEVAARELIREVEEIESLPEGTEVPPPSDADFAAIHPVLDPALGTACAIRIQVAPRGNYNKTRVYIAYARDGRLSARVDDWYSRDGKTRQRSEPNTYSWANGRLATTWLSTLTYDPNGLLVEQTWSAGSKRTFAWKVTPIASYTPLAFPSYVEERADLPWQIPYTGSVTVTMHITGSKPDVDTFKYDARGLLVRGDQDRDTNGLIARDGSTTWRWRNGAVVAHELGTTRYDFDYDDQRRLVRERLYRDGALDEELRWEYRCPGHWIDDPIWPTR